MKVKVFSIVMLLLMTFSLMSMDKAKSNSEDESARKFWGTETNTVTNCNEDCCTTSTYETYYVFWIATGPAELVSFEVVCF